MKVQQKTKIIPFTGEFYEQEESKEVEKSNNFSYFIGFFAVCFIAGLAIGGITVYSSPQQVELRGLRQQVTQLEKVKSELCK